MAESKTTQKDEFAYNIESKYKQQADSISTIGKIRALLTRRDKIILLVLLIATIFLAIMETFSISIIMPFITFASNPDMIFSNEFSKGIYEFLNFENTLDFMIFFSVSLIIFYIFRAFYSLSHSYMLNRFVFRKYHFFAYRLFCKSVELKYIDFTKRKHSTIRSAITTEALTASVYLQLLLQTISEIFTIVLLYALLLLVSWKMTLVLSILLGIQVLFVLKFITKRLERKSSVRVEMNAKFNEIIDKTLGNFKFIKLKGNQKEVLDAFENASKKRADGETYAITISNSPRFILETIGFCVLIACVAYILVKYDDVSAVIPIISMYALALYRILPAANKILTSYGQMTYNKQSISKVYEDLLYHTEYEDNEPCEFNKDIRLENIHFGYQADKPIFSNFNLTINKGQKVAFIGQSGAGKSTLVDIIIGIYKPKEGSVLIDGVKITNKNLRSWRKKIGYIPQHIFLFDGSVADNIAFGSKVDRARIEEVCKKARIWEFLKTHNGIDTRVGEGGVLLSGGQKQRIGIARAIYDEPEILVLDEATSALDNETESAIMDSIYDVAENKTLLIIAHRLSTIERCERHIQVNRGGGAT